MQYRRVKVSSFGCWTRWWVDPLAIIQKRSTRTPFGGKDAASNIVINPILAVLVYTIIRLNKTVGDCYTNKQKINRYANKRRYLKYPFLFLFFFTAMSEEPSSQANLALYQSLQTKSIELSHQLADHVVSIQHQMKHVKKLFKHLCNWRRLNNLFYRCPNQQPKREKCTSYL